jgi:predicted Holliday junction resolvase-like endonuclease
MLLTWIVLGGIAIAMYIIIYKYEKKMNKLQEQIEANKHTIVEHHGRINKNHEKLNEHHERITTNYERSVKNSERTKKNHSKLEEHDNHINQMWVTIPKQKEDED